IAIRRRTRPESPVHDDHLIRAPALIKLLFCLHHFFLVGPWRRLPDGHVRALVIVDTRSVQDQFMCWPPFTARFAPVMKPASSEQRNATSAATSSGLPRRPAGICGRIFVSRMSCGIAVTIFVAR